MKEFTENHRPMVEFDDSEVADFDKEFFRSASEQARALRGSNTAYMHRCADDLAGYVMQIRAEAARMNPRNVFDLLVQAAAVCARNARLARYRTQRAMAGKPNFEANLIPKNMDGAADGKGGPYDFKDRLP